MQEGEPDSGPQGGYIKTWSQVNTPGMTDLIFQVLMLNLKHSVDNADDLMKKAPAKSAARFQI